MPSYSDVGPTEFKRTYSQVSLHKTVTECKIVTDIVVFSLLSAKIIWSDNIM